MDPNLVFILISFVRYLSILISAYFTNLTQIPFFFELKCCLIVSNQATAELPLFCQQLVGLCVLELYSPRPLRHEQKWLIALSWNYLLNCLLSLYITFRTIIGALHSLVLIGQFVFFIESPFLNFTFMKTYYV